jgi:hypothetical protein
MYYKLIRVVSPFTFALMICLIFQSKAAMSGPKKITIKGNVVAVSGAHSLTIFNGFVYPEIIIRVDEPKNLRSQFVRVILSIRAEQYQKWMASLPTSHSFRTIRQKLKDGLLTRSIPLLDASSGKEMGRMPAWNNLPGFEKIQLPFDKPVMAFESIDWPVMPVI